MIRLPTAALAALRNRLADRGARASLLPTISPEDAVDTVIIEELGPLCDAMYAMMAADGDLGGAERDVLRGALRELDDRVRSRHVETLVSSSAEALAEKGREGLYRAIAATIGDDPPRAEAALLLAAAVAYADGEIAAAEDEAIGALMVALRVAPERMRVLLTALERIDSVLAKDAKADAADVVLHAAMHLRTAEDFERLAAKTDRPDVVLALRLYSAYVHALDELLDRSTAPASIPGATVAALLHLGESLPQHRSPRLDRLRAAFVDVATALGRLVRVDGLSAAVDDAEGASPLDELESALVGLSELSQKSLARVGAGQRKAITDTRMATAVADVLAGVPTGRDTLQTTLAELVEAATPTVPPAVAVTLSQVLSRFVALPARPDGASKPPPAPARLPEWVPESHTLGGFKLLSSLGSGGAGSVFVAVRAGEPEEGAERYALKVPQYDAVAAQAVSESEYLSVFKREAGALLALPEHPNLAGFVTFDARSRPKPLLVMELVEGTDCQSLLKQRALEMRGVLDVLDGVLSGLSAMHEAGVGHLDVKPSNVVLRRDGTPALVDFGLSGRRLRVGCATPAYASPEVWGVVDDGASPFSADVYSFACLAYELLTGRPLFAATTPVGAFTLHSQHDGDPAGVKALLADALGEAVGRWLSTCLRRLPRDRTDVDTARSAFFGLRASLAEQRWPMQP